MTIESQLNEAMKSAMRQKESDRVSCIRQVRAKVQEAVNADGFSGEVDDALYLRIIAAYSKSLTKAIGELEAGGERSKDLVAKYQVEIDYLSQYLPKLLGEDETRAIVRDTLGALGVTDPKEAGRVMGAIMKDHKGSVDPGMARRLVDEVLAPPT